MTLASIIRNGKGYAGSGNAWRTHVSWYDRMSRHFQPLPGTEYEGYPTYELWHYSTLMAVWTTDFEGQLIGISHMSTGHGSVSDQGGMNTLFRELGTPYYYSRKGGAQIIDTMNGDRIV